MKNTKLDFMIDRLEEAIEQGKYTADDIEELTDLVDGCYND